MASTWLPFAIRRPGPSAKIGYGSLKTLPLSDKEGEMKHSAEGSLAGAFGVLDNLGITSSWTGTLAKDGRVFQHYPLEAITWHAGLAGDRRTDTSLIGNLTLNGWEHEGGGPNARGEPLTEKQYQATLKVSEFTRSVMPRVGAAPPMLRRNLWEHRMVTATACPSGRIPWSRLIADLVTEDDMGMTDAEKAAFAALMGRVAELESLPVMRRFVIEGGDGAQYLYLGGFEAWHIPNTTVLTASGLNNIRLETWKRGDLKLRSVTLLRAH